MSIITGVHKIPPDHRKPPRVIKKATRSLTEWWFRFLTPNTVCVTAVALERHDGSLPNLLEGMPRIPMASRVQPPPPTPAKAPCIFRVCSYHDAEGDWWLYKMLAHPPACAPPRVQTFTSKKKKKNHGALQYFKGRYSTPACT